MEFTVKIDVCTSCHLETVDDKGKLRRKKVGGTMLRAELKRPDGEVVKTRLIAVGPGGTQAHVHKWAGMEIGDMIRELMGEEFPKVSIPRKAQLFL